MSKVKLITYGCQMSEHDSEIMAGILQEKGYLITENEDEADVIIVNTCCVRQHAEERIYGYVNSLKRCSDKNPDLVIGVSGCLAQKEKDNILKRIPNISFLLGPQDISDIFEIVEQAKANKNKKKLIKGSFDDKGYVPSFKKSVKKNGLRAWISIMKGCENFCSYCIVPYVRGKEVSRPSADIMTEIEELSEQGFKEIVLLGQNVNSYGKDLEEDIDFLGLLKKIDNRHCMPWIRYTTSHPKDFTIELVDFIRNSATICTNFHLPLQSGSDRVLKLMNRKYNIEHYMKIVKAIKDKFKDDDYSLTSDMICGFPGETEEDFDKTIELVKDIRYDGIFTFYYSPRTGTAAEKFDGLLPESERKKRLSKLIEVTKPIVAQRNKERLGKTFRIFVEGVSGKSDLELQGRTRSNKIIIFPGKKELIGKFVRVIVTESLQWVLKGKLVDKYL